MGRPVVTTTLGAEGLGASSGVHLLVADGAEPFAAAVGRLLDEPAVGARVGAAGRALVEARFDWDAIASAHEDLYARILANRVPAPVVAPDRGPGLARAMRAFGRFPAIAAGASLLAWRGARWHASPARAYLRRLVRPSPAAGRAPQAIA